jgi:hypothetical protein
VLEFPTRSFPNSILGSQPSFAPSIDSTFLSH